MTTPIRPFALVGPCAHCPFRCDRPGYLTEERAVEIAEDLESGAIFPCHQTIDYADDSAGERTAKTAFCAGALIVLEKEETPNQAMRMGELLGFYDPAALRMDAPVHETLAEFIEAQGR